jgi:2',3'-cyclic-nucleotide 2'-phosphodiesterase (5'-nucleotidase family)
VAGMNLMGYNAMALGPNELSLGGKVLQTRLDEVQFPVLSANILWTSTGKHVAQPYTVLQVGARRVGVIGLTRPPDVELPDFEYLEPEEALSPLVADVRAQADSVILLTNLTYRSALDLVQRVPGIDLLVAALPTQLPDRAVRAPQTGTLAVTAEQPLPRHAGRRIGKLVVSLGSDGTLGGESWASVPLGPSVGDDPEMDALLEKYH